MDKRTEFNAALKTAMKQRDQITVSTVRLILAALKDRDIAARTQGKADGITEPEILSMLQGMIKQRQESAETYGNAGRLDLAEREKAEIRIIEGFLPRQMDEDELRAAIDSIVADTGAASIKDMGKVMTEVKTRYAGQADMARAGAIVKEKLSA